MITPIFNMSLSTGTCHDSWKSSIIVPVPKSGDSSNPGNYRPISLLPIVSKLLEKHMHLWSPVWTLWHFWPTVGILGLQVYHQCHPKSATNELFIYLENGAEGQAVFFDLQKAFDSTPHIVFWSTNFTNWRSLAIWSHGSPVTYTTESSKLVSWVNFHLQLQA